jgi:hypothetical protein
MRGLVLTCSVILLISACAGELPTAPASGARVGAHRPILLFDKSLGLDVPDLDSIVVIKGGAAAAVYGSHSCSGVVVVRARRARASSAL